MTPRSLSSRLSILLCTAVLVGTCATASCVPDIVFPPPGASTGGMGGDGSGSGGSAPSWPAQCRNRQVDPGETDIDCGGVCQPCPVGDACVITRDCEPPPMGDPSFVECAAGTCQLSCLGDSADCNERSEDGCETDLLTSRDHCGECNSKCAPDNATGQCMNGRCLIKTDEPNQGCDPNYANCNLEVSDGCEVYLLDDPEHCGTCEDAICSTQNGVATCSAGSCVVECSQGFDACDDEELNGCETNIARSVENCGQCGKVCGTTGPGWSAYCVKGVCGQTECEESVGDCDGDGTCTDPLDTVTDCGACGIDCTVNNGSPACNSGVCGIASCDSSPEAEWEDCDGTFTTGCEVNTLTSPKHCGGCSDSEPAEGTDCMAAVGARHITIASCMAGECEVGGCESGWLDCNGDFEDGCEVDGTTDNDNCGACADQGGEVCVAKANTPGQCTMGSCDYSCNPGFADLNQDRYSANSDGCESRELVVENAGTWGSQDTGGSGPALTLQHDLEGEPGSDRLLLVGVVCRDTETDCMLTQATYAGIQLRLLNQTFLVDTATKIFYLLDADLPAPGTRTLTLNKDDSWGSISAEVIELSGAEQDTFYGGRGTATGPQNCDDGGDATANMVGLPPGSIVYTVSGGNHGGNGDCTAVNPLALSVCEDADYLVFGSGYSDHLEGDVAATLDLAGCYRSVLATVGIRPESDY